MMRRVKPTPEEIQGAGECAERGGSITAEELAHLRVYEHVGSNYNPRARTPWLTKIRAGGGYVDSDGSVYMKRGRKP